MTTSTHSLRSLDPLTAIGTAVSISGLSFLQNTLSYKVSLASSNVFCTGEALSLLPTSAFFAGCQKYLAIWHRTVRQSFGDNDTANIFMPAMMEEVLFRWFIQDMMLKQVPKQILQKLAPNHVDLVECLAARVTRVALSSLLFTLCHADMLPDCETGGGNAQLMGGLLYGAIYESTEFLPLTIGMHCLHNLFG